MTAEEALAVLLSLKHEIGAKLARVRNEAANVFTESVTLLRLFDQAAEAAYQLRSALPPSDPRRALAEDSLATLSQDVLIRHSKPRRGGYRDWKARYTEVWHQEFPTFMLTLMLFLACGAVGWSTVTTSPELAPALIPQELMEKILDHEAWFEDLLKSPLMGFLGLVYNNVKVALNTFAAGGLAGLGGLLLLGYNGVFFGSIFGFCSLHGFDSSLGSFVLAHGPLELSIIICASFASMLFGRAFFMRPLKLLPYRLRLGARQGATVLAGSAPWLVVAALLEAFMSPVPWIPVPVKLATGIVAASTFWIWTLKGSPPESQPS